MSLTLINDKYAGAAGVMHMRPVAEAASSCPRYRALSRGRAWSTALSAASTAKWSAQSSPKAAKSQFRQETCKVTQFWRTARFLSVCESRQHPTTKPGGDYVYGFT